MAVKVGRWDCAVCGHKGNLGPSKRCEKCGAPRPENVKFYLTTDAEIVTDTTELKHAKAGADWVCAYCGATNKITDNVCHSCGANKKIQGQLNQLEQKEIFFEQKNKKSKKKERKFLFSKKVWKSILLISGIVFLFLLIAIIPKNIDVTVTQKIWKRTIKTEIYKKVQKSDWVLPDSAELISQEKAIHHYDYVFDHIETRTRTEKVKVGEEKYVCGQKDLGNGYFEDIYCTRDVYEYRDVEYEDSVFNKIPVYATKYTFWVWEWTENKPVITMDTNTAPYWAVLPENVRGIDSSAEYFLIIKDHQNKIQKEKVDYKFWQQVSVNQKLKAEKSLIFGFYLGLK